MDKKSIKEVKEAWEKRLMAIPGVEGIGIGLAEESQEKCIKVFLNRAKQKNAKKIPPTIDGYSIIIELTGEFRPL